jgi:hypothetical protein
LIRYQTTIARLMLIVAFVAVDALIARAVLSRDDAARSIAYQFALIVPAAQLGLERALYGSPGHRPFWVGFIAWGLLAAVSYWPGLPLVSRPWLDGLWESYVNGSSRLLWGASALRFVHGHPGWHFLAGALVFFLPQVMAAVVGGLAVSAIVRRRSSRAEVLPTGSDAAHSGSLDTGSQG